MEINIPKKFYDRFKVVMDEAWDLPNKEWEIFWDDVVNSMESRLKVLQKAPQCS